MRAPKPQKDTKYTEVLETQWTVVVAVRSKPLDCWDRGFEYRRGHGSSFPVFVVCGVGSGLCDELIPRSEESYRVYV